MADNYYPQPHGPAGQGPSQMGPAPGYEQYAQDDPYADSSRFSYPHQSSIESGSQARQVMPAAQPTGLIGSQATQHDWRRSMDPTPNLVEQGDLAYQTPYRHDYSDPYQNAPSLQRQPSSVGPWDSASQRDVNLSSSTLPQPTSQPLSDGPSRHVHNKASIAGGLSYIDEEGKYYHSDRQRPASTILDAQPEDVEMRGLMGNAADMGAEDGPPKVRFAEYDSSPFAYPQPYLDKDQPYRQTSHLYTWLLFPTGLDRLLALFGVQAGKFPVQQAIDRKRRGIGGQKWPVAAWTLTAVMTALMVYELIRNNSLTGSPIALKPNFNYMIGPTSEVLINIGARFPPCMKLVDALPPTFQLACLNDTANPPTTSCSLESICGHGGFPDGTPDQSWRFVYPIFLHVGIIHLLLNMLAQVVAAAQVEREMGTIPFLIVYMAGGIYGFVLGGNFSRTGIPSVGASGALFATNACVLVDLLLHWKYEERPKLKAFLLFVEFAIGFGIGYIPNAVDGLAHLGGWAMGILLGIILYPSISETKRHRYIVWGLRIIAVPLVIVAFVLTIRNFYTDDPNAACEWCRFLSCIPTSSNNRCTGTGITTTQTTSSRRSWDLL